MTPINPKLLSASAISSTSSVTKSSIICDNQSASAKGSVTRGFSSPLALTSSSRALPVPKNDSLSIEDVKLPEKLKEKCLALGKDPVRNAKADSLSPDASLPYTSKYPFLSSPSKLSNAAPCNFLPDMYLAPLNKLSPLPTIKSLPNVPVEPLHRNGLFSSSFKASKLFTPPTIKSSSIGALDSPKTLETRTLSFSEQFTPNTSPLNPLCSSPYPLYYKSMFLPGVKTPSEPLSYRPYPYTKAGNNNFLNPSISHIVLSPKTFISDNGLNPPSHIDEPYALPYLDSLKTSQTLRPINTIQLPKSPSNIPILTKSVSSAQNTTVNNIWPSKQTYTSPASVAFKSTLETPKSVLSPISLRGDQDTLNSSPYLWTGRTSEIKLQPCTPPKIKPPAFTAPKIPLVPFSPSSPIVDMLSNRISTFDCSKTIDIPDMFPILGICTEPIEKINPSDLSNNCQTSFDSKHVPVPFKYSPPIIPTEPIPTISSGTSYFSPTTYYPSKISQTATTPVSYINHTPTSPIAQVTSNMVSSVTNLVSNIVQNILSSYKPDIHSAPQNIPQTATYTTQSDPYADVMLIPEEIFSVLSVVPFPQENPMDTITNLPVVSVPIDCLNGPALDPSTIVSDALCQSSIIEITSNQPVLMSSPQPTVTVPPSSLITFSSPQFCPSYVPSPILPSYPDISSPYYMEAPVFKKRSSKKDSDVEKMIELMLLAEILNNDENFDWDDLDTLLAFLSLN